MSTYCFAVVGAFHSKRYAGDIACPLKLSCVLRLVEFKWPEQSLPTLFSWTGTFATPFCFPIILIVRCIVFTLFKNRTLT